MPSTSTRRTVSPLRRVTPTNSDARNLRARRSTSSSSATPSKAKNPDYGRFTPLASQPQTISSNAGNAPSELVRFYPTPSPPPLDLAPLPVPVVTSKSTPLLEERMTYTSLPSTPVLGATIPEFSATARPESVDLSFASQSTEVDHEPFSLWDYLREELLATDFDSHQELKWERVSNFLNIPIAIEKIVGFGYILCLDSFLHTFTIQPIRFFLAACRLFVNCITFSKHTLPPSQKADLLRVLIMMLAMSTLVPLTDASKIYHSIRGQDNIKIYVIYNALEVNWYPAHHPDILDCLFSRSTLLALTYRLPLTSQTLRPFLYFGLASCYLVLHSLVLVYQLISLNVAINSYDNALLTLLISNQFVEIKGSVFKKFEKDNLFQITCADIVERFQLSSMLLVIALRNTIELSSDSFDLESSGLPQSFKPVMTVLLSELVVDWLKHAFITKFNHIRPSVYERYTDVLCRDLLASGSRRPSRKNTYVDQSPLVARRLGLPTLPLAVLVLLIGSQLSANVMSLHEWNWTWERATQCAVLGVLIWLCLVTIKLMLGVNLLVYATSRKKHMDTRAQEDEDVNKFGRNPIGEGKEEQGYNRELKTLLNRKADDAGGGAARKKVALEDLTRFTMVKRIW
ncbi:Eukaryotic membrane protein family, partial [Rhizoctonia solani]